MRILFYIGHPAHYHNFSKVLPLLQEQGHDVLLAVREKDVVKDLVEGDQTQKVLVSQRGEDGTKFSKIISIFLREITMLKVVLKFRPQLMVGTDIVITHIGKLLRIPSVIVNEDDASEVPLFAKMGMKYATHLLSPVSCNVHPYESKNIEYLGYQELAYLHPTFFKPNSGKVKNLRTGNKPYFIIRFASLAAHHDDGKKGINKELGLRLLKILLPHGNVFITSEKPLDEDLEPYRIKIHPKEMHHALYFADMYIGDSQTMAAEAAVLGTPSFRFNDFVGRLGYLEELEHKYQLTLGIQTSQPDKLLREIKHLLESGNAKEVWRERQKRMLKETIDVANMWVWFFANYPSSVKECLSKKDWQEPFKNTSATSLTR